MIGVAVVVLTTVYRKKLATPTIFVTALQFVIKRILQHLMGRELLSPRIPVSHILGVDVLDTHLIQISDVVRNYKGLVILFLYCGCYNYSGWGLSFMLLFFFAAVDVILTADDVVVTAVVVLL